MHYDYAGHLNDAIELLDAEIARGDPDSPLRLLFLRVTRTEFVWSTEGLSSSDESLLEAGVSRINEIRDAEPTLLLFNTLRALGWHLRFRDPDQSFELHAEASRVLADLGHGRGAPTGAHIDHLRSRGRFDEALSLLEDARPYATKVLHQATIECDIGILHHGLGHLGTAATCFESALAHFPEPQIAPGWCAYTSVCAATVYLDTGDWDRADATLAGAAALEFDDAENRAWVLVHRAMLAARRGDTERALRSPTRSGPCTSRSTGRCSTSTATCISWTQRSPSSEATCSPPGPSSPRRSTSRASTPTATDGRPPPSPPASRRNCTRPAHRLPAVESCSAPSPTNCPATATTGAPTIAKSWPTWTEPPEPTIPSDWADIADAWRAMAHVTQPRWALLRLAAAHASAGRQGCGRRTAHRGLDDRAASRRPAAAGQGRRPCPPYPHHPRHRRPTCHVRAADPPHRTRARGTASRRRRREQRRDRAGPVHLPARPPRCTSPAS